MKLSIIIPCYNEENTIKIIVEKVLKFNLYEKEIIIIDDCSIDSSRQIIKKLSLENSNIKFALTGSINVGTITRSSMLALQKKKIPIFILAGRPGFKSSLKKEKIIKEWWPTEGTLIGILRYGQNFYTLDNIIHASDSDIDVMIRINSPTISKYSY